MFTIKIVFEQSNKEEEEGELMRNNFWPNILKGQNSKQLAELLRKKFTERGDRVMKKENLENQLAEIGAKIDIARERIKKLELASRKLKDKLYSDENELRKKILTKKRIERLLLLEKPFNEELILAREWVCKITQEAKDGNITVNRRKDLDILYKNEMEKLRQMSCDHRLIIGYRSRYSNSEDGDEWSGYRRCLVCGQSENGKTTVYREEIYKTLVEMPYRIIELMSVKEFDNFDFWQPLPEILQWLKEKYK